MNRKKKKFRWSKTKIKKCVNGSISVLLCLLITPILSVTLALIEYARYQEAMEIADELVELTELFALANYDSYIHTRFGVLAVSQENALGDGLENVLVENARITGNQLVPSNVAVSGKIGLSLQDTNVLKQQLLDFSQLTSPAALVMEDLDLRQLLEKLNSLKTFSNITNTVDQLATATGKVTEAVEAIETLKSDLTSLQNTVSTAKSKASDLVDKFSTLVKRLGDDGITLTNSDSPEAIQAAIQKFVDGGNGSDSLLAQIEDIYVGAKELSDSLENIMSAATKVKSDAATVISAVKGAASAIQDIDGNDAEKDQNISGGMTTTISSVVQDMEKLVNETLKDIEKTIKDTIEDTVNAISKTILEDTGLSNVMGKYTSIANGSYFSVDNGTLTISEQAKQDIIDFLKMAHDVYGSGDGSAIKSYFEGRFVPNISLEDLSGLLGSVDEILNKAAADLQGKTTTKLSTMMEKLSNLSRKIFSLSVFADNRLDAVVTLGNPDSNGAQSFLDAVNDLTGAIDDFESSIGSFDLIGVLKAIWDLLVAIKDMFAAIMKRVGNILAGIAGLGGGFGAVYDRLLISEYMIHSLPCRTDAGESDGGVVQLSGKSLSGYPYKDIARGSNTFKGAELEYIYAGTNNEKANQSFTFWDLYFLRLLIDLPAIFTDGEVASLAAAANIAAWVVYIIYILAEPFLDTLLLVNGEKVPLIKTKCWLTVSGMTSFIPMFTNAVTECDDLKNAADDLVNSFKADMNSGGSTGGSVGSVPMDYKNYLLVMLTILVETDKQVQRLGNLIHLETDQHYQENGKSFDMTRTYTALVLSADMTFNPFVDLGLLAGGVPLNLTGHITRTISY